MAGADGVDAQVHEHAQAPFKDLFRHGRAQASGVVVNANAFDLQRFPIEKKSLVRIELDGANSKGGRGLIDHLRSYIQAGVKGVQYGRFRRPQLRVIDIDLLDEALFFFIIHGSRRGPAVYDAAFRPDDLR